LLVQVEESGQNVDEFIVLNSSVDLKLLFGAVEKLKSLRPKATVSALTVEEIAAIGKPRELCDSLRQAGADGLIGNGVEIFLPVLRHRMWHHAGTAETRAEVRDAARAAGLAVPSVLVQRGLENPDQQAKELLSFRGPGGESFAAVSFDPDASTSLNVPVTTGMQEMKQIAIARLALEGIPHIRGYWEMLGSKLVQIALRFGASALDGTPLDTTENLEARSSELEREIKVAGREPQQISSKRKLIVLA
jgi:aminodeoxyfutalosine synthase